MRALRLLLLLMTGALIVRCTMTSETSEDIPPVTHPTTPETPSATSPLSAPPATTPILPATATPRSPSPDIAGHPSAPSSVMPPGVENSIARASADLAGRLGVSTAEIEVVSVTPDEFLASNLGCGQFSKQPDRPIPALVTGQRIVLTTEGDRYVYHAAVSRSPTVGGWRIDARPEEGRRNAVRPLWSSSQRSRHARWQ